MLLAELIKEKDYIEKSIYNLLDRIVSLSCGNDTKSIDKCFSDLEELFTKHQKFSISIERNKNSAFIKVNNTKLSLADAIVIKESMEQKLNVHKRILTACLQNESQELINVENLYNILDNIQLDVKTMGGEIDYGLWNVEVS